MRWTLFHSSVRFNKPICMRPSQAADSRTVDSNHIGNSLGLAESKRLSEVCYQPAAGLQILYQRQRQILVSVRRAQALICCSCKTSLTLNVLRRPARPLFPLLLSLVGGTPCCFLPKWNLLSQMDIPWTHQQKEWENCMLWQLPCIFESFTFQVSHKVVQLLKSMLYSIHPPISLQFQVLSWTF